MKWDIYEISTESSPIHGVMLRGRIRKLWIEHGRNVLVENAEWGENIVRFAVPNPEDPANIIKYVKFVVADAIVQKVGEAVENPVLSKLKVNDADRYVL